MRRWLVVMAKRPRAGAVKSRLSREVGMAEAMRFYRANLARLMRANAYDSRWTTVLAVSPDISVDDRIWPSNVRVAAQGAGDLGDRMQRIMDGLPPGPAIIVGSDILGIRPFLLAEAFRLLGHSDAVFGPAEDGGFWLAGLKRSPRIPRIFGGVRWSSRHALADTLDNCRSLKVGFAATLPDVDDREDWLRWRRG